MLSRLKAGSRKIELSRIFCETPEVLYAWFGSVGRDEGRGCGYKQEGRQMPEGTWKFHIFMICASHKSNAFFNPKDMKDEGDAAGQEVEYQPSDRFDTPFETN